MQMVQVTDDRCLPDGISEVSAQTFQGVLSNIVDVPKCHNGKQKYLQDCHSPHWS